MDWQEITAIVIVIAVAVTAGLRWWRSRKQSGCDDCATGSNGAHGESAGRESPLNFVKKSR